MATRDPFAGGASPGGPARPGPGSGEKSASEGARAQDVVRGGRLRVAPDPERDLLCCRLPLTDLGNAERWRVRFGDDFRFCPEIGWFAWDGRRWKLLSEEKDSVPAEVIWSVTRTVRAIRNEAALVAASGYPPVVGLSEKQLRELEAWTEAERTTSYEMYLGAWSHAEGVDFDEAAAAAWLGELEPMDVVLDKGLWSQKIAAWANTSEQAKTIGAVVKWVKGFRDVVVRPEAFDRDRMAINVENGTLRLVRNTVKLSAEERRQRIAEGKGDRAFETRGWKIKRFPHAREDLITKLAPVKYVPGAKCPAYEAFIARVQPDETMRRFLHQWGGYSLTGDIGEHKLAFFHGGGRNGKGTWVETVAAIAGDYAGSIGIDSLAVQDRGKRGDQATPDIARLPGVRFLRVSEPPKGMSFNDGLIKQLTGGDPVDARHLNKGFFTFLPSFKLTISGNNKPRVRDLTHGMWSRMQLVPWDVTIPEEEIDTGLGEKLRGEASGILNRLLEGLIDWMEHGLIVPEQVRAATRAYRDDSDDLGRFLTALCEVGPSCRVGAKELWEFYDAWANASGGATWTIKGFKGAMSDKGFEQKQSDGMKWIGVQLRPGITLEDVKAGRWPGASASGAESAGGPSGVGESADWDDFGEPPPDWGGGP